MFFQLFYLIFFFIAWLMLTHNNNINWLKLKFQILWRAIGLKDVVVTVHLMLKGGHCCTGALRLKPFTLCFIFCRLGVHTYHLVRILAYVCAGIENSKARMYWGNTAVWAFPPLCLIDSECVNKVVFEHVFSVFVPCSHLLLSSCNRCIHTLGSPRTLLHSVVSTQLHTHRHAVETLKDTAHN